MSEARRFESCCSLRQEARHEAAQPIITKKRSCVVFVFVHQTNRLFV